jgi:signal transduction histidine kinase
VVAALLEHGVPALDAITGLVMLTTDDADAAPGAGAGAPAGGEAGREADGAAAAADGRVLVAAGAVGYPPGMADRLFARVARDARLPVTAAVIGGRPIWIEDPAAGARAFPGLARVYAAVGAQATAALPLADGAGRVLGALVFHFGAPRRFDAAARALLEAVARQCAQALERARLFAAERTARADAERARRRAEEASAAKGQFLATMSHEIRTPINAALGYAELLALGVAGPVTDQQRDYLARLQASSRHLLGLVNEVLDHAKAEAGEMSVAREPAMTGEAVAAALAIALPQAEAKGIRLVDARAGGAGVAYVGDEVRVRQILVNLLVNAVKFTPPGGRVTVTCDTVVDGGPSGDGPRATLRVEDTGVGIAADAQERIFAPFHQVDGGRTRAHGGTGLGLTISRRLARLMGGDLTVESRPDAGSTFTLWLPAAVDAAAPPSAAAPPAVAAAVPPADGAAPGAGAPLLEPGGLAALGAFLRERLERVLEDYVERVRRDPELPPGVQTMSTAKIEDHAITFFGDVVQSLVAIEQTGGPASDLVRDGTEIQRFLAELHGRQRCRIGWSESQLARDYVHKADALETMTRRRTTEQPEATETAVRVLRQLVNGASCRRPPGVPARAARRGRRPAVSRRVPVDGAHGRRRSARPPDVRARASRASRASPAAAQGPRERPVERVGEGLLLARAVGAVAAGLDAGAAQPVHEVPHRQTLADALAGVLLATRVDHGHAPGHEERRQRDVGRDGDVARRRVLHDVAVRHVGAAVDADGGGVGVPGREEQALVGDEDGVDAQPLGRAQADVLHVAGRGVGVEPESHRERNREAVRAGPGGPARRKVGRGRGGAPGAYATPARAGQRPGRAADVARRAPRPVPRSCCLPCLPCLP